MGQEHHIQFDKLTDQEYLEFRMINNVSQFQLFCLEYGLDQHFAPELINSVPMKNLFRDFSMHAAIVQDLFSYTKELASNSAQTNYVSIKMRTMQLNVEECVDKVTQHLDQLEQQISETLNQLLSCDPGITLIYAEAVANFLNMFIDFHKLSKRYSLQ